MSGFAACPPLPGAPEPSPPGSAPSVPPSAPLFDGYPNTAVAPLLSWGGCQPSKTRGVHVLDLNFSQPQSSGGGVSTIDQECKTVCLNHRLFYELMQVSSVGPQSVHLSVNTRSPSSLLRLVDEEEEG